MKKYFYPKLSVCLIFVMLSCSNEENVTNNSTELSTTVVVNNANKKEGSLNELMIEENKVQKKTLEQNEDNVIQPKLIAEGSYAQALMNNRTKSTLFTNEKGNNIFVKKNGEDKIELLLEGRNIGNNYGWSKDGSKVFYREKLENYQVVVKSIDVNTKEINTHPEYDANTELKAIQISDTIYTLDRKTLRIEGKYKDEKWVISGDMGNFYKFLVSPNGQMIIGHKGANMYLFGTDGKLIQELGQGIATSWSFDSERVVGFMDESKDGHEMSGSELYLYEIKKGGTKQLTETPNVFEMWPSFTSNNTIIYTDDVNKKVYTLQLK
ncbi:MAG: hypothetical protein HRT73_14210 [Flavobacteriales bacterium]|nr:hypothetical protein [Flavobacteriales bacterium]